MKLSIIICTYDRVKLATSLVQNLQQLKSMQLIHEIILVDNHEDKKTLKSLDFNTDVIFAHESNIGLSYARNKGAELASSDWLIYLDDDILANETFIPEIVNTIKEYDFHMFTGVWTPWYQSNPPKWLPKDTGHYILKGSKEVRSIGNDNVTGLIMVIHKQVLKEVGGFPTNLGMTGEKVAYGEESYVEQKVKEKGYKVGINPNIIVEHLVGSHKYKLSWHIKAAHAKGRDGQIMNPKSKIEIIFQLIKRSLTGWIKPSVKLMFRKKYFRQNWWIDYYGGIQNTLGRFQV